MRGGPGRRPLLIHDAGGAVAHAELARRAALWLGRVELGSRLRATDDASPQLDHLSRHRHRVVPTVEERVVDGDHRRPHHAAHDLVPGAEAGAVLAGTVRPGRRRLGSPGDTVDAPVPVLDLGLGTRELCHRTGIRGPHHHRRERLEGAPHCDRGRLEHIPHRPWSRGSRVPARTSRKRGLPSPCSRSGDARSCSPLSSLRS